MSIARAPFKVSKPCGPSRDFGGQLAKFLLLATDP